MSAILDRRDDQRPLGRSDEVVRGGRRPYPGDMIFRAELQRSGGTTTGFEVPEEIVTGLGGGGRPKVVVTVNGYEFRSSIARMGGRYLLGVSAERRAAAGVEGGQVLDVEVTLDQ